MTSISKLAERLSKAPKPQELAPPLPVPADVTDLSVKRVGPVKKETLPQNLEDVFPKMKEDHRPTDIPVWATKTDAITRASRQMSRDVNKAGGIAFTINGCSNRVNELTNNGTRYFFHVSGHRKGQPAEIEPGPFLKKQNQNQNHQHFGRRGEWTTGAR